MTLYILYTIVTLIHSMTVTPTLGTVTYKLMTLHDITPVTFPNKETLDQYKHEFAPK